MKELPFSINKRIWKPFVIAVVLGVGLHNLFALWSSILTEFIAPVNESIWEHIKIVFWPLLAVMWLYYGGKQAQNWLTGILAACAVMLGAGWLLHIWLGVPAGVADYILYVVVMAGAFVLAELLRLERSVLPLALGVTILLAGLIFAFTAIPPRGMLFHDPSLADAWVNLSCAKILLI